MQLDQYQKEAMRTMPDGLETALNLHNIGICVHGMADESAGEILPLAYYANHDGNFFEIETMMDELGDWLWYASALYQLFGVKLSEHEFDENDDEWSGIIPCKHFELNSYPIERNAVSLSVSSAELLGEFKKINDQCRPFEKEVMIDALDKAMIDFKIIALFCNLTLDQITDYNIAKLGERYKGDGFTIEESINRDYETEKQAGLDAITGGKRGGGEMSFNNVFMDHLLLKGNNYGLQQ